LIGATIFVAFRSSVISNIASPVSRFSSAGAASATPGSAAGRSDRVRFAGVSGILEQQAGGKIRKTTDPEANSDFQL
jgi:hypothetical protein